jgi:hypothetical protein
MIWNLKSHFGFEFSSLDINHLHLNSIWNWKKLSIFAISWHLDVESKLLFSIDFSQIDPFINFKNQFSSDLMFFNNSGLDILYSFLFNFIKFVLIHCLKLDIVICNCLFLLSLHLFGKVLSSLFINIFIYKIFCLNIFNRTTTSKVFSKNCFKF